MRRGRKEIYATHRSSKALLLTTNEVATIVGYSVSTLKQWRREGKGPVFLTTDTGGIRYSSVEVQRWLNEAARRGSNQ